MRADEILAEALALPEGERRAFVERASGGDAALREEALRLLAFAEDDAFLPPGGAFEGIEVRDADSGPRAPGETIGNWRIVREIGRGGMAVVYLAERADGSFEQRVALKLVKRGIDTDDVIRRFALERRILARVDHPGVARLLDGGTTEDGQPYFVMEFVDGLPIDRFCDERNLDVRERVRLFLGVADAVADAHRNLVVHRDLKPSNVLVDPEGRPKLLDFGIAKVIGGDDTDEGLTRTGVVPMTPAWASPEQLRGEPVTTASDVYQLGLLLRQLVGEWDSGTSLGDLRTIVEMGLREDPARRYPSVAQLRDDLARYLEGRPVAARPDTWSYRTLRFVRRHRTAVALASTSVWLLLALAVTMTYQAGRIARERDRANREAETATRVRDLLVESFRIADPREGRGERITAREILDRGAVKVHEGLEDQPEVKADLLTTIGRVYQNLGLYDRAEPLLEDALSLRKRTLGDDHEDVARGLNALAWLREQKGSYADAEPLYREALGIARARFGPGSVEHAGSLNDLALLLHRKGDHAEAEPLFREAIAIYERAGEGRTSGAADARSNLALLLQRTDRLDEAEALHREALSLRREILGADHADVAISLDNLGRLLFSRGDLDGAEPLLREALASRRRLYGDEHPQISESLNNLASLLFRMGDLEGAEEMFRRVVAVDRKLLGDAHPDLGQSLSTLGVLLERRGRSAEAVPVLRDAIAIFERSLGEGHWLLAGARVRLGLSLASLREDDEAGRLLETGHAGLVASLGEGHDRTRAAAKSLEEFRAERGR